MSIGGGMRYRVDGRTPGQMRPVSIEVGVQKWAAASLIYRQGDTHVVCSATVEDRIPPHLRGKGTGWVTAEYAMLPAATSERMQRESMKGRPGGRTYEIQRLIVRALRGVVDTSVMGERTVTIDCGPGCVCPNPTCSTFDARPDGVFSASAGGAATSGGAANGSFAAHATAKATISTPEAIRMTSVFHARPRSSNHHITTSSTDSI